MQYEIVFKVIGGVHVILAFLKLFLLFKLLRRWILVLVPPEVGPIVADLTLAVTPYQRDSL